VFFVAGLSGRDNIRTMPRRVKQSRSLLAPLTENLSRRLSNADARLRRKVLRISLWVIGFYFFCSLMMGTYSVPRIVRLEMEKKGLTESNQRMLVELIDSDRVRRMLTDDPRYIEYIARTRYYMVCPRETIYYFRGR